MYSTPSRLLFKFNGFDQPDHELFPDEICDAGTSHGWRDTSPLTNDRGKPLPAEDGWGGAWGVSIYPLFSSHYAISIAKREASNSKFSRSSLGYQVCSRARIIVRDTRSGGIFKEKMITSDVGSYRFHSRSLTGERGVQNELVIRRDAVMPLLEESALIIELEVWHDYIAPEFHVPHNSLAKAALKLLASGKNADVSFIVGDTVIYAHKLILELNAGLLHTFADKADVNSI